MPIRQLNNHSALFLEDSFGFHSGDKRRQHLKKLAFFSDKKIPIEKLIV
jgi:hypothetical protein